VNPAPRARCGEEVGDGVGDDLREVVVNAGLNDVISIAGR
jgi:hypothetical protein